MGELVPGRDALEHLRAEGVEADVHAVQPGVQKGGQLPGQQDAVGGQGDFVDAGDGFQPRHQLVHVFAHQRLAASDPDGIDAALGKESREAEELFVGQHGLPFQLLHAVRHTVAAAQVAQVGDGEAKIVDIAAGRIKHSRPPPGHSGRSCRRSFPPDGSRPAPSPCPRPCTYRRWSAGPWKRRSEPPSPRR